VVEKRRKEGQRVLEAGTVCDVPEMADKIRELDTRYNFDAVKIEKPVNRHVYDRKKANYRQMLNIAVKVGENRAKAEALYWFCDGLGLPVVFVSPIQHGTKLNQKQIEALTGYTARTNEHVRDAIVLAWV
jgi:hypothetical protein